MRVAVVVVAMTVVMSCWKAHLFLPFVVTCCRSFSSSFNYEGPFSVEGNLRWYKRKIVLLVFSNSEENADDFEYLSFGPYPPQP